MTTSTATPVRPRILSPVSGESMLLASELLRLWECRDLKRIALLGEPGAGKTTALQYLATVLPPEANLLLLDEPDFSTLQPLPVDHVVLYAFRKLPPFSPLLSPRITYRLAPWEDDDLIEYLLSTHKDRCAAVMTRLQASDRDLCQGLPELWCPVLDQLSLDDTLPDARSALRHQAMTHLHEDELRRRVRTACLEVLAPARNTRKDSELIEPKYLPVNLARLLRHRAVQVLLAADQIADDLRRGVECVALARRLPRELVREVGIVITDDRPCLDSLRKLLEESAAASSKFQRVLSFLNRLRKGLRPPTESHAMAASILHAAGVEWLPQVGSTLVLKGAYLERVRWPGAQLAEANLDDADLATAELCDADLHQTSAHRTNFRQANLRNALLAGIKALEANFTQADLSQVRAEWAVLDKANLSGANLELAQLPQTTLYGANLTGAVFRGANLTKTYLQKATLEGADFSDANLTGARLAGLRLREATWLGASFGAAQLRNCDLEGLQLPAAHFEEADLEGALLTACSMPGANLNRACLCFADLGEVDLEGASLQGADLRGATFHMGSSRSGLVNSPLASEGSRTGFYTDDFEEQYYKAPEEIRKANLCRADLRGALIDGVDFYLVDLRDQYDSRHEDYLRRCGAILQSRHEE